MAKAKMGKSQLCRFISLFLRVSFEGRQQNSPKIQLLRASRKQSQMQGSDDLGDSTAFPKLSKPLLYTALMTVSKEESFTGRLV